MSFAVPVPAANPDDDNTIEAAAFWPEIVPAEIREAQRIDTTVTAERLRGALIEAIAAVNAELGEWRAAHELDGATTIAAVAAEEVAGESIHVHRYRRAVGCMAKANQLERYRDYDTTARGERKADVLENPIDDLRRDARWAISDILGVGRSIVELL